MRLQLGCFDQPLPGWTNTDITPHILIGRVPALPVLLRYLGLMTAERFHQHRRGVFREVRYLNVRRRFPFRDATVEVVFTSHMLEHLYADEAQNCVREVYRVLKPGGICRIVVPDLDRIVSTYDPENPGPFLHSVFEFSDRKSCKNVHHWHYNAQSLSALLRGAGFSEVLRCGYQQGRCPDLDQLDNRPESLFMEGLK